MKVTFPIELTENLTGTLNISTTVQRETRQQALRNGIDAEELENLVYQKLAEVSAEIETLLGVEGDV